MTFSDFVGHEDAKLALVLNAIDPGCGGVLFTGERGGGKSTLSRLFKKILPEDTPFIELPLNVTEDALLGGIDIEETIKAGRRVFQPGILSRADHGVVYVDDINLLSLEMLSLVLEVSGLGENIIEREGIAFRHTSRFILVATMNEEEGVLSPHLLDRFGMMVLCEGLEDVRQRIEIMKTAAPEVFGPPSFGQGDHELSERIRSCRLFLKDVTIPVETMGYIVQMCIEANLAGSRGDICLMYASRAHAAYRGSMEVTRDDVDAVAPLVLAHRKRASQQQQQQGRQRQEQQQSDRQAGRDGRREPQEQTGSEGHEGQGQQHGAQPGDERPAPDEFRSDRDGGEPSSNEENGQQREAGGKEEVFDIGASFRTKRMMFRKDRINRLESGRRTKTGSRDKSGRYIKGIQRKRDDIAIDATLRAAAPYQKARGRTGMVLIHDDDLRFKQREKKMGHLVVFVVDGSGSMGARRRMVETKGAVQSLLMDCYQKRDRVSMIVFRRDRAEVVLPPTSSVELASKRLKEIPVGGKTPLTAGLMETYRLIKRVTARSPETRVIGVLITDGRANQGLSDAPIDQEIEKMTRLLSGLRSADYIVVDTEDQAGFFRTGLARKIASRLDADYHTIDGLKSGCLFEMVRMKKTEGIGI